MKTFVTLIVLCALWLNVTAQSPQKMSYQAVIRDSGGNLVSNKQVKMRITILEGALPGTNVYQETQTPSTNANGLVTVEIGGGARFDTIHWGNGIHYIKTETDPSGGSNYTITGTSQLLSVPYALYAKSSGNSFSGDYNDLTNKPVILNNALQTTATGYQALLSNTGPSGTANGYQALWSNTTGNDNTATGTFALKDNLTGWGNTANGSMSLMKNTSGYRNTASGMTALHSNTSGTDNAATGAYALFSNTIGWNNTADGTRALHSNTEGNYNTATGAEALYLNTTGSTNTGNGFRALYSNTSGQYNTALGFEALYSNTTGYSNTATGLEALFSNTTGIENTANGVNALRFNSTGNSNTATGYAALYLNTEGTGNIANGALALYSNTTGSRNSAGGYSALHMNTAGNDNTAIGWSALYSNTTGNENTAFGSGSLLSNTTGYGNTATGYQSLNSNTEGYDNTAAGYQSLLNNTDGILNTAHGYRALRYNTTGDNNTANGGFALDSNTTGNENTANGALALNSNTTGNKNTATGDKALFSNTTGECNTANGQFSLFINSTGINNTAVGYGAGSSNKIGNNNVFIGSRAGYYETGSNKLIIDNQSRAGESDAREKALIYGVFDADPVNQVLTINGTVNVNSHKITNVTDPVNAQDAATKAYVEKLLNDLGIIPKNYAGTMKDLEGNVYKTVQIGSQVWMAESLRTGKYNDGSNIPLVTDNTAWANLTTPGYCWYNNNQGTYSNTYGALYNWFAVNTGKLCPAGWHVPSDAEWNTLTTFLGGESVAGGKMKETGTNHWHIPNTGATNESGFSALPGGNRSISGSFVNIGIIGFWWSYTESSLTDAWNRGLPYDGANVSRGDLSKKNGFSIRCLRDF